MPKQIATVAASAARTATGQSSAVDLDNDTVEILFDCTAVSGTSPSLTLSVEWSDDGTTWFQADPADQFTAITAVGKKAKSFTVKAPFMRTVWTISGTTPSFTFAVKAYV